MSEHTAGPWFINLDAERMHSDVYSICSRPASVEVAQCENLEDAQLVVVAPELLDVVRRCELWLGTHVEGKAMQAVCRAVIVKAEGRSS